MKNAANACKVVAAAVAAMPEERTCKCGSALAHAILTDRAVPETTRRSWGFSLTSTSCKRDRSATFWRAPRREPPRIAAALIEEPCGQPLFGILAEGLADRFEPALCDAYARPVLAGHRLC